MSADENVKYETALQNVESEEHSYNQLSQPECTYDIVGVTVTTESPHQYIELSNIGLYDIVRAEVEKEAAYGYGGLHRSTEEHPYNEISRAEGAYDTVYEVPLHYTN